MPNLIAHRLFIDSLIGDHKIDNDVKEALRLGTQGPDPLFYYGLMPFHAWHYLVAIKRIGNKLHKENGQRFLESLYKEYQTIEDDYEKSVFGGFIMGQLAHLFLDRSAHPFIYYFSGFDPEGHLTGEYHYAHAHYEGQIDSKLAQLYPEFDYREATEDAIPFDKKIYSVIDKHLVPVIKEMFGYNVSNKYYSNSVINMRAMQKMTRNKVLKSLSKHNMFNALYTPQNVEEDVLNSRKETWKNPVTGETSDEDFLEIFKKAVELVEPNFEVYFEDGLGLELLISAIKDCDYRGVKPNSVLKYCRERPDVE